MLNIASNQSNAGLRCEDCGATAARNGNPFTTMTLRIHQGRMHGVKNIKGETLPYNLTRRQHEIMERIVTGQTERAVAEQLGLSYHTIHQHVRKAYEKLGLNNRVEAVKKWLEQRNGAMRTVEPLSPPVVPPSIRYCPGCGCHLAPVTAALRAS